MAIGRYTRSNGSDREWTAADLPPSDESQNDETFLKPSLWFMAPAGSCERKKSFAGNLSNRQRDTDMIQYLSAWCALKADRRAVTALEYALIAGVIVATILV